MREFILETMTWTTLSGISSKDADKVGPIAGDRLTESPEKRRLATRILIQLKSRFSEYSPVPPIRSAVRELAAAETIGAPDQTSLRDDVELLLQAFDRMAILAGILDPVLRHDEARFVLNLMDHREEVIPAESVTPLFLEKLKQLFEYPDTADAAKRVMMKLPVGNDLLKTEEDRRRQIQEASDEAELANQSRPELRRIFLEKTTLADMLAAVKVLAKPIQEEVNRALRTPELALVDLLEDEPETGPNFAALFHRLATWATGRQLFRSNPLVLKAIRVSLHGTKQDGLQVLAASYLSVAPRSLKVLIMTSLLPVLENEPIYPDPKAPQQTIDEIGNTPSRPIRRIPPPIFTALSKPGDLRAHILNDMVAPDFLMELLGQGLLTGDSLTAVLKILAGRGDISNFVLLYPRTLEVLKNARRQTSDADVILNKLKDQVIQSVLAEDRASIPQRHDPKTIIVARAA